MAGTEAYMLQRNNIESRRLDFQHSFVRALGHGHILHPSIPPTGLRAVADVGTGTGIWLRDLAGLGSKTDHTELVGFDISPQQFPTESVPGTTFIVHDTTKPYPQEYHEKFDLVHVRFLSYALKTPDIQGAVECILQILRPGGYLQWQEFDAIDGWASPETANTRDIVSFIVSEREARGLPPAIAMPLIKALQSLSISIPLQQSSHTLDKVGAKFNPISWTNDLVRIMYLETLSTYKHPSPVVHAGTNDLILPTAAQFLLAGISRRRALATQDSLPAQQKEQLLNDVDAMNNLVRAIDQGADPATSIWNTSMTWIVARKAMILGLGDPWMTATKSM